MTIYVKCDVEGAELFDFQEGSQSLEWSAPFGYQPDEIIPFPQDFGYRCFTATNANLVEFFHMIEEIRESNFFLHRERQMEQFDKYLR